MKFILLCDFYISLLVTIFNFFSDFFYILNLINICNKNAFFAVYYNNIFKADCCYSTARRTDIRRFCIKCNYITFNKVFIFIFCTDFI